MTIEELFDEVKPKEFTGSIMGMVGRSFLLLMAKDMAAQANVSRFEILRAMYRDGVLTKNGNAYIISVTK